MAKPELKVSVRWLVEYFYRSGDLDLDTYTSSRRMQQGIRAHQKLQNQRPDNYQKEITVSSRWETREFDLIIRGRIDGLYLNESGVILEEIKSITRKPDEISNKQFQLWWGQAKIYAAIYCADKNLKEIDVQLALYELERKKESIVTEHFKLDDLQLFLSELRARYYPWALKLVKRISSRNQGLARLEFPFRNYRKGQRGLAVAAYRTIRDEAQLLVQAPTGIGKTMAVLFPGLKALGLGEVDRIFYLTARTTGKEVAANTMRILLESDLNCRVLVLTSKERICFKPESSCTPEECEFAKGYYDRLGAAVEEIFAEKLYTREIVEAYSKKHNICPFEFSLEIALWCDCIICDYNYAFDPRVYLRRFFEAGNERYSFLVDEAHNLVDRSRDMFSSELYKSEILSLRRKVKGQLEDIYKLLGKLNSVFLEYFKAMEKDEVSEADVPAALEKPGRMFLAATDKWLAKNIRTGFRHELLEIYFKINAFMWVCENYSERYRTLLARDKRDLRVKLFCLDPSQRLAECLERCRSVIFFSATLTPFSYFNELFGCRKDCESLNLPSPFPAENLSVSILPISTRYRQREQTLKILVDRLEDYLRQQKGNLIVYFPSYKYLKMTLEVLKERECGKELLVQESGMTEKDRSEFLQKFEENGNEKAGLAVMGGVFGEGIDLVGKKLEGAAIVGVGLPGIDQERELIRNYYEDIEKGYDFAYTFAGLTRVLQAAGRVIRTERDTGSLLLIDDRFFSRKYRNLLPLWWNIKPSK